MGKTLDLDDILSKITTGSGGGSRGGGGNGNKSNDMTEQEQADQLLELLGTHTNPVNFKEGDFCRYRKEIRSTIRNGDRLHIVLEKLPEAITVPLDQENFFSHVATCKYDVIVGLTDPREKGSIMKFFADSRWLELWPKGEKLKPTVS